MPRNCSVGGCKSRDNHEARSAGITFHKLPKLASRRKLWISNSLRGDCWDPQSDFVYFCSKHFTPESFEKTGCSGTRRLKEDAVPSAFDFSAKHKKTRTQHKDIPVRKAPSSDVDNIIQEETTQSQTTEDPTALTSTAAQEDHENVLQLSQEPSELGHVSPPPLESRPVSPSRFMRRLPPPPGFYLSKEHSYAQHCPLLWRRRYDQAIDSLEKALSQLHAARRRESRLRSTVLRLRDKQVKHMALASLNGRKNRGNWTPGGDKRGRDLEDRQVDQMVSEEERGYCLYCGRGKESVRASKTWTDVETTECEGSLPHVQKSVESSSCVSAYSQSVRGEQTPGNSDTDDDASQTVFQVPAGLCLNKAQYGVMSEGDPQPVGQDRFPDLQPQLVWIQDSAEGQLLLLPAPNEHGVESFLKMDGAAGEEMPAVSHTPLICVPQFQFEPVAVGHPSENDSKHNEQQLVNDSASVGIREDIREKLKEHLEGFHLQLSTEFTN
ncbi:THAP domain-containing protein 7 [Pholidichthys leucotaenia]